MNAADCRNLSNDYWKLTDEQIKKFEAIEYTPYHTPLNAAKTLTDIIDARIRRACELGLTSVHINLFGATDFQGWQIRDMMPYLRYRYMKDGFNFSQLDCTVSISWKGE